MSEPEPSEATLVLGCGGAMLFIGGSMILIARGGPYTAMGLIALGWFGIYWADDIARQRREKQR